MTAPAGLPALQARSRAGSSSPGRALRLTFAASIFCIGAAPAEAQVGAAISVFSDYRFRGNSLSESRPVAILDLSYDASNGLYGAASGSVVAARGEGLRTLGLVLNAGYAKQLKSGLTIDMGAVHSSYSAYSGLDSGRSYTELYAGLRGKIVSARVGVSPDYFGSGWTAYSEVTGQLSPTRNLRLEAAVGTLVPLSGNQGELEGNGRLGIDWRSGRVSLHAAIAARGGGRNAYAARRSSRATAVLGVSYAL